MIILGRSLIEALQEMAQYIFTMQGVGKVVPPKRIILRDISLSFFPGAKIGVLGLNGSGKSTLLELALEGAVAVRSERMSAAKAIASQRLAQHHRDLRAPGVQSLPTNAGPLPATRSKIAHRQWPGAVAITDNARLPFARELANPWRNTSTR